MTIRRIDYGRLLLLLAVVSLVGCPPRVLPRNPMVQLFQWMLGGQNRADPKSPDVFLVRVPKEKIQAPPTPQPPPPKDSEKDKKKLAEGNEPPTDGDKRTGCIRATSFVPDPHEDGRFFFAVDGALHVLRAGEKTTTPLDGLTPGVTILKLAATRNVSDGLELIAWVRVEGKSDTEMHTLVVNASRIVRSGIADVRVENIDGLLALYTVPRCTPDGTRCVEISENAEGSTYIDQQSRTTGAHSPSVELIKMAGLVDVTWTPANDGSMYILQGCASRDGAGQTTRP